MCASHLDLFPFPAPRPGQREFLRDARECAASGRTLVAHAPTGLGKTAVALAASLEASMAEDGRTVFLTPRQSQHRAVVETVRSIPARVRMVDLLSRESMCPHGSSPPCLEGGRCHLEADGRIAQCAREVLRRPLHAQDLISMCLRKGACPYLTARMALGAADLVIGDVSRVFGDLPDVLRFQSSSRPQRLVVDEAHNLPARIMDMFSRTIVPDGGDMDAVWRDLLSRGHRTIPLGELRSRVEARGLPDPEDSGDPQVQEWFRLGDSAMRVAYPEEGRIAIRFMEPELVVRNVMERCAGAIFMSGTLHPTEVFASRLGLEGCLCRSYPSPFDPQRRLALAIPDVGTRYRERSRESVEDMAFRLAELSEAVPGNVMAFLPSYSYLSSVRRALRRSGQRKDLLAERPGMGKCEKDGMAQRLLSRGEVLMLCNIHGSFAEGVDFPAGCVSAVMVAGLPLPPPSLERREMVRRASSRIGGSSNLDLYEALCKVLQACGRAIRREEDRAAIVLMDPRYLERRVMNMMPPDLRLAGGDPVELLQAFFGQGSGIAWRSFPDGERIITGQ